MCAGGTVGFGRCPLSWRVRRPIAPFVVVTVAAVGGFSLLGRVGLVEAAVWVVGLASVERHSEKYAPPERLTRAYTLVTWGALVPARLWLGQRVLTAVLNG
jgi:voltage-gated potassium channel